MSTVKATLHGSFEIRCDEFDVSIKRKRHGIVSPLARALVERGCDPARYLEVWRGETLVFEPRGVGEWALRALTESDTTGFSSRLYRERDFGGNQEGGDD